MTALGSRGAIARTSAGVLAASVVSAALSFAVSVLIGRSLGPAGKGVYDLIATAAGLATVALGLSLQAGVVYGIARRWADRGAVWLLALGSGAAVGLLSVVGLAGADAALGLRIGSEAVLAIGVLAAAQATQSVARAGVMGSGEPAVAAWLDLAGRVVGLVAAVAAVSLGAIAVAYAVAAGFAASGLFELLRLGRPARVAGAAVARMVAYALPGYFGNLVQYLNYRMDLFVVAAFRPAEEVGLYAIAGLAIQLLWMPAAAVASTMLPTVSAHADDPEILDRVLAASRSVFAVTFTCALVGGLAAGWAIPLVYGPPFGPAALPILIILPGAVLFAPSMVVASYFAGVGRVRYNLWTAVVTFAITLALDLTLIPGLGMVGAAIASTAAYAGTAAISFVLLQRIQRVPLSAVIVPSSSELRAAARLLGRR